MRTTQQFSITLPIDMAEIVEQKIKSGMYASASEVMRDGVRALLERDAALERWLREEVVAGHHEYTCLCSKTYSITECGHPRPRQWAMLRSLSVLGIRSP